MNFVEVVNRTRTPVDEEAVARLVATILEAEQIAGAEVAVEFVGEGRIRALNRDHRGLDAATDVLSFPLEDWPDRTVGAGSPDGTGPAGAGRTAGPGAAGEEAAGEEAAAEDGPPWLLGDIVICPRVAVREARREDLPPALELAVLLAHGTLHLLGYDHEIDAGIMALRQAEVLELVDWEGLLVAAR